MKDQKNEIEMSVFQTPQKYSNRNLELQSDEFVRHINEYEQWLRVLGYANSTIYDFPSYVRAFLYFLENKKVCN
jgi:integrase/recombinase XerD